MKRGKGLARFDLAWRDHLRDGQGVDLPPCFGCVDIANRRIRRAEVDTNDETTRFLRHRLILLRFWHPLSILTDAELQLPALVRHGVHAPQLEYAQLRNARFELHRHIVFFGRLFRRQGHRQWIGLARFLVTPMLEHIARLVVLAYSRAKKPEETGFAYDQPDGCRGYPDFGTFLHAEGHDTQRFQWPRRAWNGQAGRFDAHIVRTRRPPTNANTPAGLGKAVVRGSTRHGVIQIGCTGEHLWLGFLAVPSSQDIHETIAKEGSFEDPAAE